MPQRIRTTKVQNNVKHMANVSAVLTDRRRGSAASRGYDGKWQKARAVYLVQNPLCVCCEANGRAQPSELIDHIRPHRMDLKLFWRRSNWQALCTWCHNNVKAAIELAFERGEVGADQLSLARPIDGWLHPVDRQ